MALVLATKAAIQFCRISNCKALLRRWKLGLKNWVLARRLPMTEHVEGRAKRKNDRTRVHSRAKHDVERLVRDSGLVLGEQSDLIVSPDITEPRAAEIQQEIKAGIEAPSIIRGRKRATYLAFGDIWTKLMAQTSFNIPPELPVISLPTPHNLFTPEWMERARYSKDWRTALNSVIAQLDGTQPDDTLLHLTIASAIFHGLLLEPNHVVGLANALSRNDAKLKVGPFSSTILLFEINPTNGLVHSQGLNGGVALVTFVPDAITLGLLVRYLSTERHQNSSPIEAKSPLTAKSKLFERLRSAIFGTAAAPTQIKTLSQLCQVGFWPRATDGADLSHAMLAAMMGRTPWIGPSFMSEPKLISSKQSGEKGELDLNLAQIGQQAIEGIQVATADFEVIELEDLISISALRTRKREVQRRLSEGLKALSVGPPSGSIARLLRDYLSHLVVSQKRKASTFRTYASRLLHPLALAFGDLDVRSLSADTIEGLYQIALDQKLTTTSRAYCARVIGAMHGFAVNHCDYELPQLTSNLDEGSERFTIVRARIPNKNQVRRTIEKLEESGPHGSMLAALVCVAFRSGLRIGELCKLRQRDVQVENEQGLGDIKCAYQSVWIWVRQSQYGDNKTENARRKIPLSALMTEGELNTFLVYLNRRFAGERKNEGELVFCDPVTGLQLDPVKAGGAIAKVMRAIDPETPWTVHSLRHGALNAVHAAIEGEDSMCNEFFGWDPATCARVRSAIIGDKPRDVRAYHALAKFAGHASASQTWASYLHLLPWLVASKRDAIRSNAPLETLVGATGITSRTLREREVHTPQAVSKLLGYKFKALLRDSTLEPILLPNPKNLAVVQPPMSLKVIEGVLKSISSGETAVETARYFGLDADFVACILIAAKSISNQAGSRGQKRLADKNQAGPVELYQAERLLVTRPPRTKEGYQLSRRLFERFTVPIPKREDRHEAMNTIMEGINAHDSEIRFYHPSKLKAVVTLVASLLPAELWQVEIRRRPGRVHSLALRRWRAALGEGATLNEVFLPANEIGVAETEAGTALVRIKLPEDLNDGPARATSAVKYAAVMAKIVMSAGLAPEGKRGHENVIPSPSKFSSE
jgi:integrase